MVKEDVLQELLESHINGNLGYVRKKFKALRSDDKSNFLKMAKEQLSSEDYDFFIKSIYA